MDLDDLLKKLHEQQADSLPEEAKLLGEVLRRSYESGDLSLVSAFLASRGIPFEEENLQGMRGYLAMQHPWLREHHESARHELRDWTLREDDRDWPRRHSLPAERFSDDYVTLRSAGESATCGMCRWFRSADAEEEEPCARNGAHEKDRACSALALLHS